MTDRLFGPALSLRRARYMADARSASPRSLFLGGSLGGGVARKRIVAQEYGSSVTVSVAWARRE
jgi:hypothetical protein